MKRITLTTAILMAIKAFGNLKFSIHNITTWSRDEVNNGNFEVYYLGDTIPHSEVKETFEEIVDCGLLDDYSKGYENGYRVYSKQNDEDQGDANTPQAYTPQTTIPTDVQLIIYNYMKNNGPVTMKQIQSRLKGHPYTCAEIADFLDKIKLIDPVSKILPISKMMTAKI